MLWELCARGAQRINPTAFEHESAERQADMLFCTGCSTSPSGGVYRTTNKVAARPKRQRGDSNPCGQSPMDFWSITLATRSRCLSQFFYFISTFCSLRFYTDPLIYMNLEPLEGQGFLLKDSLLVFFLQLAEFPTRVLTCFINCLFPKTPRGLEPLQAEPNGFPGQSGFDMLIVYT